MITIQRATQEDISDLQRLNSEVFLDNAQYDDDLDVTWAQEEKGRQYFTEFLNDPRSACFIAEEEGKKIGYLAAGPKDIDYRKSTYCEFHNMGVTPEYRSQGVGKLLLEHGFAWAKSQGFQKVFLNAYSKNQRAITFYKSIGFSEIDVSLEKSLS